jgi:hypothetical protein
MGWSRDAGRPWMNAQSSSRSIYTWIKYKNVKKRVRLATRRADLQRAHARGCCTGLGAVDELNSYFDVLVFAGWGTWFGTAQPNAAPVSEADLYDVHITCSEQVIRIVPLWRTEDALQEDGLRGRRRRWPLVLGLPKSFLPDANKFVVRFKMLVVCKETWDWRWYTSTLKDVNEK